MSMESKTLCNHFACKGSYYATHTLGLNVMSWISKAYECHYAWPLPEANATTVRDLMVLYHPWAACPCLSWSAVALSSAWSSPNMNLFRHVCKFEIHLLNLNFQYMATHEHTHASSNAVNWGRNFRNKNFALKYKYFILLCGILFIVFSRMFMSHHLELPCCNPTKWIVWL